MVKIHIGAAVQAIADDHADILSPREVALLYAAAARLWDEPPFLVDMRDLPPRSRPIPYRR